MLNGDFIMEMVIDFPGGAKVDAHFGEFAVKTDQPPIGGGEGSAPTPFALFLASLGTCAGIYVLGFCQQRGISTKGIRIVQHAHRAPSNGMVEQVDIEIQTPPDFPEKYLPALVRSADQCAVKKHLEHPPKFNVYTQTVNQPL
jgi:ribosomal protein S12 methylthiotransferase accessory factor